MAPPIMNKKFRGNSATWMTANNKKESLQFVLITLWLLI